MLKPNTGIAASILISISTACAASGNSSVNPPPKPSVTPPPAAVTNTPDYHSGSVATVYQLIDQGRNGYQQGQPIGSFVNTDNPWSLNMHLKQPDLAFFRNKPLGYEMDAYFVAKEAGNYSFAIEVAVPPAVIFTNPEHMKGGQKGWINCDYQLSVAEQKLFEIKIDTKAHNTTDEERFCGLTQYGFGTMNLEPGLHRVRQELACMGDRRLKKISPRYFYPTICRNTGEFLTTDNFPGDEAKVTLRVRHPQDNTPAMLKTNEFVHEKR